MRRVCVRRRQSFLCIMIAKTMKNFANYAWKTLVCLAILGGIAFGLAMFSSCGGKKQAHHKPHPKVRHGHAKVFKGQASWYGKKFHGKRMANGKRFDMRKLTAAHRTLPFGTKVRVTNLANGRKVIVTITDRGPYAKNRVIDVSKRAAKDLGFVKAGVTHVRVEVLKR